MGSMKPGPTLEAAVSLWLEVGNLEPLERALLAGYGELLEGRTSRLPRVASFLRKLPQYQGRIARVHEAAAAGKITELARILDQPVWGASRDDAGNTPLQKAMLGRHPATARLLIRRSPCSINATDRMGRTPLHYAAALDAVQRDSNAKGGTNWYQMLFEAGADEDVKDLLGRTPTFYRVCCEELLEKEEKQERVVKLDGGALTFHITVEIREIEDYEDSD